MKDDNNINYHDYNSDTSNNVDKISDTSLMTIDENKWDKLSTSEYSISSVDSAEHLFRIYEVHPGAVMSLTLKALEKDQTTDCTQLKVSTNYVVAEITKWKYIEQYYKGLCCLY